MLLKYLKEPYFVKIIITHFIYMYNKIINGFIIV
jgi:hypothetical protein